MEYKLNTKLIKEKMLEKGYSINKLAYISNLSTANLTRVINKQGLTRESTIKKLSEALEIKTTDLIK
ncbi:MAG: helix-turn-helix transcriptional regulator [Peptostreptococcaceae bacterium]|nr:helix-turn-helix transcriptional regulator [Peptostreptococcaceae bacterium]